MARTRLADRVTVWQTPQGLKVYFDQIKQLPMLDIVIAFNAGSSRDGKNFGLANFTSSMINEGAGNLNADAIAAQFANLGVIFTSSTNRDMTSLSLRSLTKAEVLQPALKLFTTLLSKPTFPQKAFARTQRILADAIQAKLQSPGTIATDNFFKLIYQNYPYAHPVIGTTDSIAKITAQQLKAFHQRYYVAKNATLAIVGDITREQAQAIAAQISKALPSGAAAAPLAAPKSAAKKSLNIKYPSTQTAIRIGQIGVTRSNPNYVALVVANYILGGDSSSRLFHVVREKNGLSYGVGSALVPYAQNGPFLIYLQTKDKQTPKAIKVTQSVVEKFVKNGITQKELTLAKDYLTGNLPLQLASNSQIANYLALVGRYNLPVNYLPDLIDKIKTISVEDVNQALKQSIFPKKMVIVTVGK
ncbi:MAG: pitrilysin family protein [Pseudomonadota bacterium]